MSRPQPRFTHLRKIRESLWKVDAALMEFRRGIERDLAKEMGEEEARRIMCPCTELLGKGNDVGDSAEKLVCLTRIKFT